MLLCYTVHKVNGSISTIFRTHTHTHTYQQGTVLVNCQQWTCVIILKKIYI